MRHRDDLSRWGDDPVVAALRAPGSADELAGIDEVLTEFRAHNPPSSRSRRRLLGHVGTGVTTVVAALALSGGVAAAYSRALPGPLQQAMHTILGPVGVPAAPSDDATPHPSNALPGSGNGHHAKHSPAAAQVPLAPATAAPSDGVAETRAQPVAGASAPATTASPAATATAPGGPPAPAPAASPTAAAQSPSSTPPAAPARPAALSVKAGRLRLPAGGRVTVRGVLTTASGSPVAGHKVVLAVKPAGTDTWQRVASGRTRADGTVALRTTPLDRNTMVRLATPQGLHSTTVALTVLPVVTVALQPSASGNRTVVTITVAGGETGDSVLLARRQADGSWSRIRAAQLPDGARVTFTVRTPAERSRYRVRVAGTSLHADGYAWFTLPAPG